MPTPIEDAFSVLSAIAGIPVVAAVAPALTLGALLYAVLLWVPTTSAIARVCLSVASLAMMGRYLFWRYTDTLADPSDTLNWIAGLTFVGIETLALASAALALLFLSRVRDRSAEADAHADWLESQDEPPLVDVFICTYNEEERLLERTIIAALGMDYPRYRTWILDDGRRPWLRKLCATLGCGYVTRADNAHAKAGNINHALGVVAKLDQPPDFICILDADFVPTAGFVTRAMSLFHDPTVGIVQTPQHFLNPDPIQANMALTGSWPDEQRYFFDIVLPAKDAWGCAFCCGTSSITRFDALMKIGGLPTDSVTEDYLLTLRLKEIGYSTAYLNEPLTFGLAPEGLKEYVTQRGRWCLGFMQIVRGPSGPFTFRRSLKFIERLSLTEAFLNWTFAYLYKMAGILVPALYLLFGIKAVEVSLIDMLSVFLPYYVLHSLTMSWVSHGRVVPVMTDVGQLINAVPALKAAFLGLFGPRNQKFHVTAKGGDRSKRFVEWPVLRIFLILLAFCVAGVLNGFTFNDHHIPIGEGALALFWSWYNIVVLVIVCIVCIEQPRLRRSGRFPVDGIAAVFVNGTRQSFRLRDISVTGAHFAGTPPTELGQTLLIRIDDAHLRATLVRVTKGGFSVRFENSLKARIATIRHIYSAAHERAIRHVPRVAVFRAVFQRLLR